MVGACSTCINSECSYFGMLCNVNTCPLASGDCESSVQCIAKVKLEKVLHKYFSFPVILDGQHDALLPYMGEMYLYGWPLVLGNPSVCF